MPIATAARPPRQMTAEWGSIDRLVARAGALAGAWGARARASTTIGQERAILRLFGVTGLDARRPAAGRCRGRPLAGGRAARPRQRDRPAVRDVAPRIRPRAAAAGARRRIGRDRPRARRRAAARAATGARSPRSRRPGSRTPRSSGSTPSGRSGARPSTCSARRHGRGSASTLREPDVECGAA